MRKSIFVILCILALPCFAQNREADSLRQLIAQSDADSNRILLLRKLAYSIVGVHPDSAYYYSSQGMQLAHKIKDPKEESLCLSLMSTSQSYIGTSPKALDIALKALQLAERIGDPLAINSAFKCLGTTYYVQHDFKKALEYYEKALVVSQSMQDFEKITLDLTNIGDDYSKLNMLDSALYYSSLAYPKSLAINDELGLSDELTNLGDIYTRMNNLSEAIKYYRLALPFAVKAKDGDNYCVGTLGAAGIFQKQKKMDSALVYAYMSMAAAISSNFNERQMEAGNFIASIYESEKRSDSAFKYLKMTIALKDSLFNQEKSKSILNMTYAENIRQQELAEQKKKAEEDASKNLQLTAIAVFIPIFFLVILFLSRIRVKARFVEFLAVVGLLLSFEFITDLIYPYISDWTNDSPLWETLILVVIAALVEPVNYRLERWVKTKLVHRPV